MLDEMTTFPSKKQIEQLIVAAEELLPKAYAPYSDFQVGAALLSKQGNVYTGCNVENVSYGLSICAERNAITTAVATEGKDLEIVAIAITNSRQVACSPCGACRQFIQEFSQDAVVIFRNSSGWQTSSIRELLPDGFNF